MNIDVGNDWASILELPPIGLPIEEVRSENSKKTGKSFSCF